MAKPEIEFPNLYWNLCWKIDGRESSKENGSSPRAPMSKEDVCLSYSSFLLLSTLWKP